MSDVPPPPAPPAPRPTHPDAMRSHVPTSPPNEPISLYTGPIDFTQQDRLFRTDGRIVLDWLPSPAVRFEVARLPPGVHPTLEDLSFRLDDGTVVGHALVTGSSHSNGPEGYEASLNGIVNVRVVRPNDAPAQSVSFLLPNFQRLIGKPVRYPDRSGRASRLTLRAGGWVITLDAVEDQRTVGDFFEARSGFGITYVGRLVKEDGKTFKAEEAVAVLDALAWYASFAAGRWTGPCLPTGFDAGGVQVWQVWDYSRTVPFRKRLSWLDGNHGEQFEAPFPGFLKLWLDEDWEEVVRVAIHWYVEANAQAGSIEGSIVLTQTAFELLASAVLVEHNGWLSSEGYDKLAASDRIRLLFLWAGIPTAVPAELDDLTRQAKADNWPDTATAMTMIRNTITHPTKRNRERFGKHTGGARIDAWTLGLWNLELCLLRLFDYRGAYANRINQRFLGQIEPVPWARPA
ncbi:MAG: hypothetical protein U0840_09400 [Gemmataceae bacterium]